MHHPIAPHQRVRLWLAVLSIAAVMLACGQTSTVVQRASSVSAQIKAATGGTLKHPNGATLTIPPNALAADATVTLTDSGPPVHVNGDPLRYASDAFSVDTKDANGKEVAFKSPATLSITPGSGAISNALDVIVAEMDPAQAHLILLHHSTGGAAGATGHAATAGVSRLAAAGARADLARFAAGAAAPAFKPNPVVSYAYSTLNSSMWSVVVPSLAQPAPQENAVLQVPFYHQSGLGWCVPTSLTEMLRYYDVSPNTGDPINATFGSDTALANWQIAAQNHQSASAWASWNELGAIGVPLIGAASNGPGVLAYEWDDDFVMTDPIKGSSGQFGDFETYVIEVNTGLFGLGERKPLMLAVDLWGHSLVIVGVDGDNIYYHDSNGSIAYQSSWTAFQAAARGTRTNDQGKPYEVHDIYTAVAYGYPIRAETLRRGSIVITQGSISVAGVTSNDSLGNPTDLQWDGASPHTYGYYLNDPANKQITYGTTALGYPLIRPAPVYYQYRIANVTNVPETFTSVAELSGPNFGAGVVSQSHTITVAPYSLSGFIAGKFNAPSTGTSAFFDVKLYAVGSASVLQDVKFLRFDLHDPTAPQVQITLPANGTHVYAGSDVVFDGTGHDVDSGNAMPWSDLSWSDNGSAMGDGTSITYNFPSTGTYTIKLVGTNDVGASASASITITVDPAPPTASVTIVSPADGSSIQVSDTATSQAVELVASGSPGMVFTWSDSIDGVLGTGTDLNASLTVQSQGNCAPQTKHVITLSGTDNLNRTKTAQITIYLHPLCIN